MRFTHMDEAGKIKMVDVSEKAATQRRAVAAGEVRCSTDTVRRIVEMNVKKGDVFAAARIAGILAAKKTPELIPLCHSIPLDSVEVEISADVDGGLVSVTATAGTFGKTGVEMEALVAVSGACLCIYDMCKAADKSMVVGNIRLLRKSGGQSGEYVREER